MTSAQFLGVLLEYKKHCSAAATCGLKCSQLSYIFFLSEERGCAYCGGLGHRITECPKLEAMQNKQAGNIGRRDYLAPGAADW